MKIEVKKIKTLAKSFVAVYLYGLILKVEKIFYYLIIIL